MRIAIIAAIMLLAISSAEAKTKHHRPSHKSQHITKQVHRERIAKPIQEDPQTDTNVPYVDLGEIDDYLFEVYQRVPTKSDSHGDFTWKDVAAASRLKMDLKEYVIGGMAAEFRKRLHELGRAMDSLGLGWSILSGFRDDYRQRIAKGFKAKVGSSWHGGSRHGGYNNGRAIDLAAAEGTEISDIWHFIDNHPEFGVTRPMAGYDPNHVQQSGMGVSTHHKIAKHKDHKRIKVASHKKHTKRT